MISSVPFVILIDWKSWLLMDYFIAVMNSLVCMNSLIAVFDSKRLGIGTFMAEATF